MKDRACSGCGKLINPGEEIVRVARGAIGQRGAFQETEEWGMLHSACWARAIESPDVVFAAIKQQARDV